MKNTFIFFLLILIIPAGHAQTYFSFSEKMIDADFSAFQPMADRGFSEMNEGVFQIRPGVKFIKNNWSFNSHLSYFISNDQNKIEQKMAEFYGYGFSLGAQYHLRTWKTFKVLPSIEVGIRKYYLDYTEVVTKRDPTTFVETKNKYTVFSFTGVGVYGDLGMALEKNYELKNRTFGIGFEVGYRLDYGTWKLSEPIPIQNANANQNGLFLNIGILVALRRSHRKKK